MTEPFPPRVGERFAGRYTLKARLRGGGPAPVFLADDAGHPVAIATIDPTCGEPPTLAAFSRVVAAAADVPGLVSLGAVHGAPLGPMFCLAEQTQGVGFDGLRRDGSIPWREALELGERAAAVLHAVWRATAAPHGALVAARCLLTPSRDVLILDHGIGAFEPERGRNDDVGYRAPEQLTSRGDERSDVYSLAAVLFELIAGERPSARMPSPLRSYVPGLPREVDELFARTLHRDPNKRPADAGELRAAYRELLGLGPAPATETRAMPAALAPEPAATPAVTALPHAADAPVFALAELRPAGELRAPNPGRPVFTLAGDRLADEPRASNPARPLFSSAEVRPPLSPRAASPAQPASAPAVPMTRDPLPAPAPRAPSIEPPTELFLSSIRPSPLPTSDRSSERKPLPREPRTEQFPRPASRPTAVDKTESFPPPQRPPLDPTIELAVNASPAVVDSAAASPARRPPLDPTVKLPPSSSAAASDADDATVTFVRPLARHQPTPRPEDSREGTTFVQAPEMPVNDRAAEPAPSITEPALHVVAAVAPATVERRSQLTGPLMIANVALLLMLLIGLLIIAL